MRDPKEPHHCRISGCNKPAHHENGTVIHPDVWAQMVEAFNALATITAERDDALAQVAMLTHAANALVDLHNAPLPHKRPNVFHRRMVALEAALADTTPTGAAARGGL